MKSSTHRARGWVALGSLSYLLIGIGCSWSVPADPGLNGRLRRDPADVVATSATAPGAGDPSSHDPAVNDPAAERLYLQRCSQCHEPFSPTHVPASSWPIYVNRYGPRAGLFGAERQRVLEWLQANSY